MFHVYRQALQLQAVTLNIRKNHVRRLHACLYKAEPGHARAWAVVVVGVEYG